MDTTIRKGQARFEFAEHMEESKAPTFEDSGAASLLQWRRGSRREKRRSEKKGGGGSAPTRAHWFGSGRER